MQNNSKLTYILIALLIIVGGTAFYFGYYKNSVEQESEIEKEVTEGATDNITTSDGEVKSGFVNGKKEFTDANGVYSIQFPEDYVVIGKDKMEEIGTVYDVAIVNVNDPKTFVGVIGPKAKDKDYSDLEGLLQLSNENLKTAFAEQGLDFEVIEQDFGTEDNYSYTYRVHEIVPQDESVSKTSVQVQKNIISNDNLIVFTASTEGAKFEDYEAELKEIINSIQINK